MKKPDHLERPYTDDGIRLLKGIAIVALVLWMITVTALLFALK